MTETAECRGCGATVPRAEMFGVQDDLRCPACAQGVRDRLHPSQRRTVQFKSTNFVVTKVILGIAILLYIATDHVYPGADKPPWLVGLYQWFPVWAGEWWRHVSVVFLHGGAAHVLMNGMALWSFGRLIESGWGAPTLLAIVLLTGAGSSAASFMTSAPYGVVGLSGAICGLIGFLWGLKGRHPLATAVMTPQMQKYTIGFLLLCVVVTQLDWVKVANTAHFTGLGLGYLFGLVWDGAARRLLVPLVAAGCIGLLVLAQFFAIGSTTDPRDGEDVSRMHLRREYLAAVEAEGRKPGN